ncbi:chromosomal replication initiator protein [Desulfonauticus submarinus]|uniref:Chromosomal replication initiator protein DnaA n=1 Tax=Desulfonauticus submarinus TaxID=206665 RepID=A0A1H0CRL8_9BACT|nr:chromosomal replication initiator protein DnaA [Desulfonauticus submarinus]SDN60506.1 chromosomal replication initiator protein [Desulfonauticus submarinus]
MMSTWQRIQNILEKCLGEGIFKVWIKPLKAEIDGSKLTLTARNDFMASWVREKLFNAIREAAFEVLGEPPIIEIKVAKTKKHKVPFLSDLSEHDEREMALPILPKIEGKGIFRYSFQDFVVGPCNELAFLAARTFCQSCISSDQLFLCSSPGLGKTHLVQSMGLELLKKSNKSRVKVAYLTAEEFASQLVLAIKARQVEQFKARFREQIDILLIEDIHFFQNKEKLQDEFLCTIKSLTTQGKKVVFSSMFLPKELNGVDSQLVSRLCQGFMAVINKPDMGTILRIIDHKSKKMQVSIPKDVGEYIASRVQSDIRQLESCINNLVLKAKLLKERINLELARDVLKHYALEKETVIDLEYILKNVARIYDLPIEALLSKSRKKNYVWARNTAYYLARKYTDLSLEEIGRRFNRRHSTVLKGIAKVEQELNRQTPLGRQIEKTLERITSI